jgi:OmpA-OmpF porin, OOP family
MKSTSKKSNTNTMQTLSKKLLFLSLAVVATFSATAQTDDKKWNVGLHGGIIQYQGDLGHDFYKTNNTFYAFGGISVSKYLGKYLDANLFFARGELGYNNG